MLSKLLKRSFNLIPSLEKIDILIAIVNDINEIISSFPNGSGFGPNGLSPHVFERPIFLSLMEVLGSSF